MDIVDLFMSCRKGDLTHLKYLVENREVSLNVRDRWDSTPLYYACLCGHMDVVKYLLDNGAKCEANTFDGERCLYSALNSEIKQVLKNYKVITSQKIRRDIYEEFLRRTFECGYYSDIKFDIHGIEFNLHRSILSARSDYFRDKFITKWSDKGQVRITNNQIKPSTYRSVFQYLYIGQAEIKVEDVEDCLKLCCHCRLFELKSEIEKTAKKVNSFECSKPGICVNTLHLESASLFSKLSHDFGVLSEQALPLDLRSWDDSAQQLTLPVVPRCFVDLAFNVEGFTFSCHKVFICGRSEYFRALVDDHFCESDWDTSLNIKTITIHDVSWRVFNCVVQYIYQNSTVLDEDVVLDVLTAADMYLIPGLKKQCGQYLSKFITAYNVVRLIRIARLFQLPRLEDTCSEFISLVVDKMVDDKDFQELIIEDASQVKSRQSTDSIPVIDDIRYHITSTVQTMSEMDLANAKLKAIDSLLDELGLDA